MFTLNQNGCSGWAGICNKNETDVSGHGFTEQFDSEHGRKQHRRCWVLVVDESMPVCQQWEAKTIIAVQAERIENGKGYDFVRFYISSRALDATSALKATRAHWSVESVPQAHKFAA